MSSFCTQDVDMHSIGKRENKNTTYSKNRRLNEYAKRNELNENKTEHTENEKEEEEEKKVDG